jgi:hypothetical protein
MASPPTNRRRRPYRSPARPMKSNRPPKMVRFGEGSRPELVSGEGGVRGALGKILADVVVASSKGTWARMKICAAEDCRWAYYDHSKSRTGRWCAMETCGTATRPGGTVERSALAAGKEVKTWCLQAMIY